MNNFTKQSSKNSATPKIKNHQVSESIVEKSNNNSSSNSNCCDNDGSSLLGICEDKEIMQQVHPIVHSAAELVEPPSTPPSIHPAAHRPSSLTTQSASSSVSGGNNQRDPSAIRNVSIIVNPIGGSDGNTGSNIPTLAIAERYEEGSGTGTPNGTESPGTSQMSPPPSYHDIPGTVPAHQGVSRGPPPSYEDAVDPNAEPPSYDSLFGRIRDTHKASRNFIDFLAKLLLLLLGTIGCTIACSITIVIPVCMIVIGSVYLYDCPAEPCIPIFLIVGGSFSVLKYLIGVTTRVRRSDQENNQDPPRPHPAQYVINCFLCAWFITGCVWVYRIYQPIFDPLKKTNEDGSLNEQYCNKTVYTFAFWLITAAYIFLGLFTSCICCFSIVSVILKNEY